MDFTNEQFKLGRFYGMIESLQQDFVSYSFDDWIEKINEFICDYHININSKMIEDIISTWCSNYNIFTTNGIDYCFVGDDFEFIILDKNEVDLDEDVEEYTLEENRSYGIVFINKNGCFERINNYDFVEEIKKNNDVSRFLKFIMDNYYE